VPFRVLIVSAAAPFGSSATGLTIGSLFDGWNPEQLAIITAQPDAVPPGRARAVLRWAPAERLTRWHHGIRRRLGAAPESVGGVVVGLGAAAETTEAAAFRIRIHETARAMRDAGFGAIPARVVSEAVRFGPDVIYSPLGSFTWSHGAHALSEVTKAPVVPHFMDDWLHTLFSASYPGRFWPRMLERAVRRALARSTVGLAISDAMAAEYEPLFRLPFRAFMRCIDDKPITQRADPLPGRPLRAVYFGGLHLGRHLMLRAVADALTELGHSGTAVELQVMAPDSDIRIHGSMLAGIPILRSADSVSPEGGEARLAEADLALHVESFATRAAAYTRLSVSTKIPSYLRAGLPILAVGPPHLASLEYIASHGVGLVLNTQAPSVISASLRQTLADDAWMARTGERARCLFLEKHEAVGVRKAFERLLEEAGAHRN
jgi:hypothetical protein